MWDGIKVQMWATSLAFPCWNRNITTRHLLKNQLSSYMVSAQYMARSQYVNNLSVRHNLSLWNDYS